MPLEAQNLLGARLPTGLNQCCPVALERRQIRPLLRPGAADGFVLGIDGVLYETAGPAMASGERLHSDPVPFFERQSVGFYEINFERDGMIGTTQAKAVLSGINRIAVENAGMQEINGVLDVQFPVAAITLHGLAAGKLDFSFRRPIDKIVERSSHVRAEEGGEINSFRTLAGENKAAVLVDARHFFQAQLRHALAKSLAIGVRKRQRKELSIRTKCPGMIRANEPRAVSGFLLADFCSAMGTAVVEAVDPAIVMPGHNDLVQSEPGGEEVARTLQLTFMTNEKPCVFENGRHLRLKQRRISIETPMDSSVAHEILRFDRT